MVKALIVRCQTLSVAAILSAIGCCAGARAETLTAPDFVDTRPLPPNDLHYPNAADTTRKAEEMKAHDATAEEAGAQETKTRVAKILSGPSASSNIASGAPAATVSTVATATVSTASTRSKSPDAERYVAHGRRVLASGDVTAARAFFERALNSGAADAASELAGTYDPARLKELGVVGLRGDPARAAELYHRAIAMGATDAGERLRRLTGMQ